MPSFVRLLFVIGLSVCTGCGGYVKVPSVFSEDVSQNHVRRGNEIRVDNKASTTNSSQIDGQKESRYAGSDAFTALKPTCKDGWAEFSQNFIESFPAEERDYFNNKELFFCFLGKYRIISESIDLDYSYIEEAVNKGRYYFFYFLLQEKQYNKFDTDLNIFVFKNSKNFSQFLEVVFKVKGNYGGVYRNKNIYFYNIENNRTVSEKLFLHEYFHYLWSLYVVYDDIKKTLWLNEGIAEFFSVLITDDREKYERIYRESFCEKQVTVKNIIFENDYKNFNYSFSFYFMDFLMQKKELLEKVVNSIKSQKDFDFSFLLEHENDWSLYYKTLCRN